MEKRSITRSSTDGATQNVRQIMPAQPGWFVDLIDDENDKYRYPVIAWGIVEHVTIPSGPDHFIWTTVEPLPRGQT